MDSNVQLSISDPISADIQAACRAIEAVCNLLSTPQGQETLKAWRADAAKFEAKAEKAWDTIRHLLHIPTGAEPVSEKPAK